MKRYVVQFRASSTPPPPPPPPPPTPTYVNITISMTDTAANGWAYTFGLRQNGVVRANFTLKRGGSGTISLINFLLAGVNVDIVVLAAAKPSASNQIGFVIR